MKRLLLVFTVLLGASGMASAQNLSGAYVGASIGQSWGTGGWSSVAGGTEANPDGWLGGVKAGLNWQSGNVVFGVEGDIGSGPITHEVACADTTFQCKTAVKWLSTFRGRLGLVNNTALMYATAGAAGGDVKISANDVIGAGISGDSSKTMTGWSAGVGVASAVSRGWAWNLEWLHIDLGSADQTLLGVTQTVKYKTDVLRVGLDYRF